MKPNSKNKSKANSKWVVMKLYWETANLVAKELRREGCIVRAKDGYYFIKGISDEKIIELEDKRLGYALRNKRVVDWWYSPRGEVPRITEKEMKLFRKSQSINDEKKDELAVGDRVIVKNEGEDLAGIVDEFSDDGKSVRVEFKVLGGRGKIYMWIEKKQVKKVQQQEMVMVEVPKTTRNQQNQKEAITPETAVKDDNVAWFDLELSHDDKAEFLSEMRRAYRKRYNNPEVRNLVKEIKKWKGLLRIEKEKAIKLRIEKHVKELEIKYNKVVEEIEKDFAGILGGSDEKE